MQRVRLTHPLAGSPFLERFDAGVRHQAEELTRQWSSLGQPLMRRLAVLTSDSQR